MPKPRSEAIFSYEYYTDSAQPLRSGSSRSVSMGKIKRAPSR
jgi:hypothetical protein